MILCDSLIADCLPVVAAVAFVTFPMGFVVSFVVVFVVVVAAFVV